MVVPCVLGLSLSVLCLVLVQCIDLTNYNYNMHSYLRIENLRFDLVNYDPIYYIYIHSYSLLLLLVKLIN